MSKTTTISWILLAIGIASEKSPADFKSISGIADGINHAVPTNQEMQTSISWLLQHDLITKEGKQLALTSLGTRLISDSKAATLISSWKNLESKIQNLIK